MGEGPYNVVLVAWRKAVAKCGALSDHQRRIGLCGVTPLINQHGET